MKAKKQKSGNWRVQLYCGRTPEGKQIIKSFTAPTKREAEALALDYKARGATPTVTTLRVALRAYIAAREHVLSPATLRNYESLERQCEKRIPDLLATRVDAVTAQRLQLAVNTLSSDLAPTSVSTIFVLLTGVLRAQGIEVGRVVLPKVPPRRTFIPTLDLARQIFFASRGTELELPIILAASGLRAGEICAVHPEDLSGDVLHVCRDTVKNRDGVYVEKPPKTFTSDRYVRLPSGVGAAIRAQGYVTLRTPESLSQRHSLWLKSCGFPHFRLHDWRHYMVSSLHSSGLPDAFIMQMGGWSSPRVMNGVYRHLMADGLPDMVEKATSCLEDLLPDDHNKEPALSGEAAG